MIQPEELRTWSYPVLKLPIIERMLKAWMEQTNYAAKWPGFLDEAKTHYFTDILIEWPEPVLNARSLDIGAGGSPFSTLSGELHGIEAWRQDPLYVRELNDLPFTMPRDFDDLDFGDETVEVVTCHNFHTIREDVDAMNEIERVLTFGGQAIIAPFLIGNHDFPPTLRFWRSYTRELFEERLAPILSDCCTVEFIDIRLKTIQEMIALRIIK